MVISDVPDGVRWGGYPAVEGGQALRQWAAARRLPQILRELQAVSRGRGAGTGATG